VTHVLAKGLCKKNVSFWGIRKAACSLWGTAYHPAHLYRGKKAIHYTWTRWYKLQIPSEWFNNGYTLLHQTCFAESIKNS
jgi:hypothetical protein